MFRGDLNFFFFFGYVYLFVWGGWWWSACQGTHVEVRRLLRELVLYLYHVGSLLVSCGSSEHHAWQQAPWLTEPSCDPIFHHIENNKTLIWPRRSKMRDHCGGVNKNVVRAEGGEVEKLARKADSCSCYCWGKSKYWECGIGGKDIGIGSRF